MRLSVATLVHGVKKGLLGYGKVYPNAISMLRLIQTFGTLTLPFSMLTSSFNAKKVQAKPITSSVSTTPLDSVVQDSFVKPSLSPKSLKIISLLSGLSFITTTNHYFRGTTQKPNDLDSLIAAHYADLALVDGEGVRWLRGADNELGLRELPGFRYGSCGPFERRPARRRVDVVLDDVGKGTLGVLSELEQLGAVGRWEPTRGESAGYFGTITDAEPNLPNYTWGTRVWWETLAAEGVLYLREGDTVTFAPHAVRGFLETERCFNRLAESFMRLYTFAVGTSLAPGSRRAELLESEQL